MAAVKKYYIEANITANYSGIRRDDKSSSKRTVSELRDLLNTQVTDIKKIEAYDRKYHVVGDEYIYFQNLYGVLSKNGSKFYRTNLTNAYINNIRLSEQGKDGQYIFGKLEGIITATIEQPIEETVLPGVLEYERNADTEKISFVNNTSGILTGIDAESGKPLHTNTDSVVNKRYFDGTSIFRWIFTIFFSLFLLIVLHKVLLPLLAIAAVIFLVYFLLGKLRHIIGPILLSLAVVGLLSWMFSSLRTSSSGSNTSHAKDEQQETTEIKKDDTRNNPKDSIMVVHHRVWNDYNGNTYEGDIKINQSDYFSSKQFHNAMNEQNFNSDILFWNDVYRKLSAFDANRLNYTYQMFDSIGKANALNRADFAKMIVSCVQDIPYTLITNEDCEQYKLENPQDVSIIDQTSCFGPIKYGVQSPNEFLYNLKGDCDTRTVLCYTLLSHYNYDVAILTSAFYRHSILGVGMPAGGAAKSYNGKDYLLWETTAKNCAPGFLAPDFNNLNYWDFALVSK